MINIYLICSEIDEKRLYKIGFTRRKIEERIKEFKTGNASDIYIVDHFRSKWGTKIEARLHEIFKNKHVSGEWFNLDDDDISNFKGYCEKHHNTLEIISTQNTYYLDHN
jgi:hypothetical protein